MRGRPDAAVLRDVDGLLAAGLIRRQDRDAIRAVAARYAVALPPALRHLIEEPDDPIARQFVPDPAELLTAPHERADPIGDDALSPVRGIVHRYPDRALLKPLLACPVYCRFCFRREHVGPDGGLLTDAELRAAMNWLRDHAQIREVILTGGDPLMLSTRRLGAILAELAAIPHVQVLRIHTRMPVATPERLTEEYAGALDVEKALWLVLHVNHPRELSASALGAIRRVRMRGIPVLGQSVLLRGVNDDATTLETLFRAMISARIKPYYLHQLDAAPGTSRFHVPIEEGLRLMAALRGRVSGVALPTYVLDIPGGHGKVPLGPSFRRVRAGSVGASAPHQLKRAPSIPLFRLDMDDFLVHGVQVPLAAGEQADIHVPGAARHFLVADIRHDLIVAAQHDPAGPQRRILRRPVHLEVAHRAAGAHRAVAAHHRLCLRDIVLGRRERSDHRAMPEQCPGAQLRPENPAYVADQRLGGDQRLLIRPAHSVTTPLACRSRSNSATSAATTSRGAAKRPHRSSMIAVKLRLPSTSFSTSTAVSSGWNMRSGPSTTQMSRMVS
jgi:lysine 2,3-aminomutase